MTTTAVFDELYGQLNKRQREAVDTIDGPVMVIAGPGTGKTKILTLRIANILARTDTPPEGILALTFTESGATEMRGRLATIIGTDAYRVAVTTFHAFCNSVIQDYPEAFGPLAGAASLTEADQAVLLTELIDSNERMVLLRPVNAPDLYLKAALSTISTLKHEGVTPDRLSNIADDEEKGVMSADDLHHEKGVHKGKMKGVYEEQLKQIAKLRELAILYGAYQNALRERRLYDYNDMVMEVARALESDGQLRLMLQEQHQYILVDEHQDTNNAQNRVIELLASFWEKPNLFVVGDAKQAIYRFQGASIENFHYFQKLYPGVKLIALEDNYRSSQLILEAAHGVRPSEEGLLTARAGHEDTPIKVLALSSPDAQYWAVASHIRSRLQSGVDADSIAVLSRDNADAAAFAEFLARMNIPYSLSTQLDAMSDRYVHQLLLIIDAIRAFGTPAPLYSALHAPVLAIEPLDLYKLNAFCRAGRNPYDVMRSPALMHEAGIDGADRMRQLASQMSGWAHLAQMPQAADTLELIVRESGLLAAIVADPAAPEALARLHALYNTLKSHVQRQRLTTLASFAEHIQFLRKRGIALTAGVDAQLPGRVRVMTAHKSKGLEFPYVYLIDAVDGHWGSRVRRQLIRLPQAVFLKQHAVPVAQESDDEERNLFYVALTRAKREVVIAMSQRDQDGKEELPVRYLADIAPSALTYPDTAALEEEWTRAGAVRYAATEHVQAQSSDREYLNMLFREQGLSVTALNNYLLCPWKYFYTSLLRIPEAPAFALMYGNAVDRALQEYFDRLADGTRGSREDLVGLFEGFVRHQPFQEHDLTVALERGRTALSAYYERYHDEWTGNVINQLKVPAVALTDDVIIKGKIDKVELLEGDIVRVVDYKTGKSKSRNQIIGAVKDGDGNYFRQLVFYKMLLDRYQNGRYRMKEGVIDFVEPDAKGKWHREVFAVTPAHVGELEATVELVAKEILDLAFWNKRCGDRDCAYCPLRDLMEK